MLKISDIIYLLSIKQHKMFKTFKKKIFTISGNNNIQINGKCIKNGKEVINFGNERNIEIIVQGNCKNLDIDSGNVEITGDVKGDLNVDSGNVNIKKDVNGNVEVNSGNVKVSGNIDGSVSIDCGTIIN